MDEVNEFGRVDLLIPWAIGDLSYRPFLEQCVEFYVFEITLLPGFFQVGSLEGERNFPLTSSLNQRKWYATAVMIGGSPEEQVVRTHNPGLVCSGFV